MNPALIAIIAGGAGLQVGLFVALIENLKHQKTMRQFIDHLADDEAHAAAIANIFNEADS